MDFVISDSLFFSPPFVPFFLGILSSSSPARMFTISTTWPRHVFTSVSPNMYTTRTARQPLLCPISSVFVQYVTQLLPAPQKFFGSSVTSLGSDLFSFRLPPLFWGHVVVSQGRHQPQLSAVQSDLAD